MHVMRVRAEPVEGSSYVATMFPIPRTPIKPPEKAVPPAVEDETPVEEEPRAKVVRAAQRKAPRGTDAETK